MPVRLRIFYRMIVFPAHVKCRQILGCGTARRGHLLCKQNTGRFESDTVHQVYVAIVYDWSRTHPFQGCKPGSTPGGDAKIMGCCSNGKILASKAM